ILLECRISKLMQVKECINYMESKGYIGGSVITKQDVIERILNPHKMRDTATRIQELYRLLDNGYLDFDEVRKTFNTLHKGTKNAGLITFAREITLREIGI